MIETQDLVQKFSPLQSLWDHSALCAFTGAVLHSEASKWHTTPTGTQRRHGIVWSFVGFSLRLARTGEIRCTAATQLLSVAPPLCDLHRNRASGFCCQFFTAKVAAGNVEENA